MGELNPLGIMMGDCHYVILLFENLKALLGIVKGYLLTIAVL